MIFSGLLHIFQSEHYDRKRFLKFVYSHFDWWNFSVRGKVEWTLRAKLLMAGSIFLFWFLLFSPLLIAYINYSFFCEYTIYQKSIESIYLNFTDGWNEGYCSTSFFASAVFEKLLFPSWVILFSFSQPSLFFQPIIFFVFLSFFLSFPLFLVLADFFVRPLVKKQ